MAFTQRGWPLPGDGARLVRRSELAPADGAAVALAGEADSQLDLAFGGPRSGDRDGAARRVLTEILADCGQSPFDLARADLGALLAQLKGLIARGVVVWVRSPPAKVPAAAAPGAEELVAATQAATRPTARRPRKVVSINWDAHEAWCSEATTISGTTENYADDESLGVDVRQREGAQHQTVPTTVDADRFVAHWAVKEVLPARAGSRFAPTAKIDAAAGGRTAPRPLTVNFVTALDRVSYRSDIAHFDLSLIDDVVHIHGDIKYLPGWGGYVVKLENSVARDTGGLLDGQLAWPGYRWMKRSQGFPDRFWDGETWRRLPAGGFALLDDNHFAVGFYEDGDRYTCQYGGHWPYGFSDWNIDAPVYQTKLDRWRDKIQGTWSDRFDLKREDCLSRARRCCSYRTRVSVNFSRQRRFSRGMVIIADGILRSNDSVWFLGQQEDAVAAHEFGHHLGNPDEYGQRVDTSLNSDGAHQGVDPDSIMGQHMASVKARHLRQICAALREAVADTFGKSYNYRAVPA
jgi:hypothetical protein